MRKLRCASEVRRELELLLRSRSPAVGLSTWEEGRGLKLIKEIGRVLSPSRDFFTWSAGQGLQLEGQSVLGLPIPCSLGEALSAAMEHKGPAIFTFLDADLSDPLTARQIRDLLLMSGNQVRSLVFISPHFDLRPTLTRVIPLLELPLPDKAELKGILNSVAGRCSSLVGVEIQLDGDAADRLADAARGLTSDEAERAYMRALLDVQRLSVREAPLIVAEKRRVVEEDPLLTFLMPEEKLEDLGGLDTLRNWLANREKMFSPAAAKAGLPPPRGVLLVGVTGCGRGKAIRAAASTWELPLLRLEVAKLLESGLGGERTLRRALCRAETFAPCVLLIPSLDQLFSRGSEGEGGAATAPVAASLQAWMLEKDVPVFVAATADDHERLPLDLIWKGAFDEVFFVDFPSSEERRQILKTLLQQRGLLTKEMNLEMLVAASEGFSGAQILQAILRGMGEAFARNRPIKMIDIVQSLRLMTPMAGFMGESRRKLRSWAHRRALAASPQKKES